MKTTTDDFLAEARDRCEDSRHYVRQFVSGQVERDRLDCQGHQAEQADQPPLCFQVEARHQT